METKVKKETPFELRLSKKAMEEYKQLSSLRSFIHFYRRYKKCIYVNKRFKKKIINASIITANVASLTLAGFLITKVIPKTNIEAEPTSKIETKINNDNSNNSRLGPILSEKSLDEINKPIVVETMPNIDDYEIEEDSSKEYEVPTMTISFPKASNTNVESDYNNYYKVKEKYGAYIDKIARESGIDSRILIAMIAQENPDQIDETRYGTYGPMCVTTVHNAETYNYGHYDENGDFINEKVTIDINKLKPNDNNNQLYENGKYGNITNADAWCIYYGAVIIKEGYYRIDAANDILTKEEKIPLAISAYNHGYPDVIKCTKNSPTLFDACYSIRYDHAGDVNYDDDQYLEHVLNKIPDEELNKPFRFVDNNGNEMTINIQRNNEIAAVKSDPINKNYAI